MSKKVDLQMVFVSAAVAATATVAVTALVTWAITKSSEEDTDKRLAECKRLAAEQDRLLQSARSWGWPGQTS
jgi:hypothetical protein